MLDYLRRFVQPGNVAALATLLVALGIETDQVFLHHCFEIAGAILAGIGFFLGGAVARSAAKPPVTTE